MNKYIFSFMIFSEYLLADVYSGSGMDMLWYILSFILFMGTLFFIFYMRSKCLEKGDNVFEKTDLTWLNILREDIDEIEIEKQPFRLSGMLHILTNKISDKIRAHQHTLYYDVDKEVGRYIIGDNDYLEQTLEIVCKHLAMFKVESEIILHLSKKEEETLVFEIYNKKAIFPKKKIKQWNMLEDFSENIDLDSNFFVKAKKIAKAMDGRLTLNREKKRGLCYRLEIPYYPDRNKRNNQETLKEKLQGKRVLFIGKNREETVRVDYVFQTFGLYIEYMSQEDFESKRPDISKYDMLILRSNNLMSKHIFYLKQIKDNKKNNLKIIIMHNLFESEQKIEMSKLIADAEIYAPMIIGDVEEILYQMYILQSRAVKGINNMEIFNPSVFRIKGSKQLTKEDMEKFKGGCIIVAEDSKVDQRIIRHILENKGLTVFSVKNGLEVLELLEREPIDMIFSDINMPVMDGLSMTKKIRQRKEWKDIPIISISSMSFGHEIKEMQVAGMNAAIPKPIVAEDVYVALKRFLKVSSQRHNRRADKLRKLQTMYCNNPKILDIDKALLYFKTEANYINALREFVSTIDGSADLFAKIVYEERYRVMSDFIRASLPFYKKIEATEMVKMFEEILAYLSYENNFYMAEYAILYQKNLKILLREIERYLTYMNS